MGQKVNPIGFRLGITKTWNSIWFAKKNYQELLHEDLLIKRYIKTNLGHAGISRIEIERSVDQARINIFTSKPGIIIGKKGLEVDKVKKHLQGLTKKQTYINIKEIRYAELDAQLVAENVALQMEKRVAFRRAMKKSVTAAIRMGAKGIKIACAGRLGGAEMARRERYLEGRVPLHTLRADIDYGLAISKTTYGIIGVKVWIYKGEKEVNKDQTAQKSEYKPRGPRPTRGRQDGRRRSSGGGDPRKIRVRKKQQQKPDRTQNKVKETGAED